MIISWLESWPTQRHSSARHLRQPSPLRILQSSIFFFPPFVFMNIFALPFLKCGSSTCANVHKIVIAALERSRGSSLTFVGSFVSFCLNFSIWMRNCIELAASATTSWAVLGVVHGNRVGTFENTTWWFDGVQRRLSFILHRNWTLLVRKANRLLLYFRSKVGLRLYF